MTLDFSQNIPIASLSPKNQFQEKVISFLQEWHSDSPTLRVQTSGSTGSPKVLEVEKEKMRHSAKMTCDFLGLKRGDTALLCLPVEYISGKMMLVRALERGLKIIIAEPSATPLLPLEETIHFTAMTPLQVLNSLDKIHYIQNLIIGGAAVSEDLKRQLERCLENHTGHRVFETYGMSETLSHIALKRIFPFPEAFFTVFEEVYISVDERNCLKIEAPKISAEVLQTNDIIALKNEKEFKFLGRYDNVINSGGVKIYPEEVENIVKTALGEMDISKELVLLGKPDKTWGEKLVLVIEGRDEENIGTTIFNLPFQNKFQRPKEVLFLEKFPRTDNGKVLRKEILKHI